MCVYVHVNSCLLGYYHLLSLPCLMWQVTPWSWFFPVTWFLLSSYFSDFFFLAATCFMHFLNLEISEAMVLDCLILKKTSILCWVPNCSGLNSIPPNDIPKSRMCRWDHPGLRLGPNLMTGVLPRGTCTGPEAQRRRPCDNRGRERRAVTRPQATRSWRRPGMILP